MLRVGSVTTITPQIIVEECARHGVSKEKLLNGAGIPHAAIHDATGQVPLETMRVLWENAIRLTGNPMLGLHAAEKAHFGAYRVLDYMFAVSANPKEGFLRSSCFFGIMNNAFTLMFRVYRDRAYLELHSSGRSDYFSHSYVEYILALFTTRLRLVTQVNCKPTEVHVTSGPPQFANEYERKFGTRVRFRQAVNCLVFAREVMDIPHRLSDPELCELLESHARRSLTPSCQTKPLFREIREALVYNLANGRATLSDVSAQLSMSPRTLQRRIIENGVTFRDLLDEVRQEQAPRLLQNNDFSMKEVALRLQFSNPSSFSHAFSRWTGLSPTDYRKALQPGHGVSKIATRGRS